MVDVIIEMRKASEVKHQQIDPSVIQPIEEW